MTDPLRLRARRPGPELPRCPKGYSREARGLWQQVVELWELDPAALALLDNSCRALMRCREAQRLLARDGIILQDRSGRAKAHPAVAIEQGAMLAMLRHMRALELNVDPIRDQLGRPAGTRTGGKLHIPNDSLLR
jgi:phage terminase small subunit